MEPPVELSEELPEVVRARLVTLVAAGLEELVPLPAALQRVAGFAPVRRAKLGATTIVTELLADPELRGRVAANVAPRVDDDELSLAALAWLERSEGWQQRLADVVRRRAERSGTSAGYEERERRLRERLQESERAFREQRATHREALTELRSDNANLRRALGQTRGRERVALEEAEETRATAQAAVTRLQRELRAARAEVVRLEGRSLDQRQRSRSERNEATTRARLLLDTLSEAAAGLRRELALPAGQGAPGDRVEAALAGRSPSEGSRDPSSVGSLDQGSPALLEQYLSLPRPRLLIDGYNITKTAWPTLSLETQRTRLLTMLAALAGRTGAETTVVFDAAASVVRPVVTTPRGVKVIFSPRGVIADDVIEELARAEPAGRVVVVATDDRELVARVARVGARTVAGRAILG